MLFHLLLNLVLLYVTGGTAVDLWATKLGTFMGGQAAVAQVNFIVGSVDITSENLTMWTWIVTAITLWILWDILKIVRHYWRRLVSAMRDEVPAPASYGD